jgi:hypothetical protein
MSQRVRQIFRDLVVSKQWTKHHNPWHNPADFNGVKYMKSHAQILLDRADTSDFMWFLAHEYLVHIHNLFAKRQIDRKMSEQISKGRH